MDKTVNLELPYIMPAQAQKHVTHNEALRLLDGLVNLSAEAFADSPPANPDDGDVYLVSETPQGDWVNKANYIAMWQDGAWQLISARKGWRCALNETETLLWFDGSGWVPLQNESVPDLSAETLGVNTSADAVNRLAVSADAVLLTAENLDHRLTINKAAASATAGVVFQNAYTGHAQLGISGDNDLRFSTSPDGMAWKDSLVANSASGSVHFPNGASGADLHGVPREIDGIDRLYVSALSGDDANDGFSGATPIKTSEELMRRISIGRSMDVYLMSDLVFDTILRITYPIASLNFYGRTADDTGWTNRKIIVQDSVNHPNHPGSFIFRSFTNVYTFRIDVELATSKGHALFNFYNTIGYLRTQSMNVTRIGAGDCCVFSNGGSFVPSQHVGLNVDPSAAGYMATDLASGVDPNSDWRYPSNLNNFG